MPFIRHDLGVDQYAMLLILSMDSNAMGCSFSQTLAMGDWFGSFILMIALLFLVAFVNVNWEEIADKMMKASGVYRSCSSWADTRRYITQIVLRLTVLGPCIWSSSPRASFFLFVMGYDLCAWPWFQELFSCLSGWFTISEKKCPFEWINVIQEYSRVTMYYFVQLMELTASGSKQLPLVLDESIEFDDTINQVRIFKQKWSDLIASI